MTVRCCTLPTPCGELSIAEDDGALVVVTFGADRAALRRALGGAEPEWHEGTTSPARRQLAEYFAGRRRAFDLPLQPRGTPFQQQVWRALGAIPFGRTCSYADVAARIGRPTAVRAVGAANGRNPIPIVVPCHRVIGRDGSLTGYAGGLDKKLWLLAHEGVALPQQRRSPGASA